MNSEIIAVGTELLHGDILNTNAQYISKKMATIGVDVHYHTVVGDNATRLEKVFATALDRADILIVTGGLGPTKDDITKEVLAKYLGLPMVYDAQSEKRMKAMFEQRNREMTENNLRQAYFPQGAQIIENVNGTANACKVEHQGKVIYLLPGPPKENNPLIDQVVVPQLHESNNQVVINRKIRVTNLGESSSETLLMDLIDNQTNPTIAPYAGNHQVIFRVTAKADSEKLAKEMIEPVVQEILQRLGENAELLEEE